MVGLARRHPTGFYSQSAITQLYPFDRHIHPKWFPAMDGLQIRNWATWPVELEMPTCQLIQSYLDELPFDALLPYQFGKFDPLRGAKENRLTFGQIDCFLSHLTLWYVLVGYQ
jgi:hypothetical protein